MMSLMCKLFLHIIRLLIWKLWSKEKVFMSFIYGDLIVKLRDCVWEKFSKIGLNQKKPWFMIEVLIKLHLIM